LIIELQPLSRRLQPLRLHYWLHFADILAIEGITPAASQPPIRRDTLIRLLADTLTPLTCTPLISAWHWYFAMPDIIDAMTPIFSHYWYYAIDIIAGRHATTLAIAADDFRRWYAMPIAISWYASWRLSFAITLILFSPLILPLHWLFRRHYADTLRRLPDIFTI